MNTRLIKLQDGTLVEVEVRGGELQPIAGGAADHVAASIDKLTPILIKVCQPIVAAWGELNKDMSIEHAEVELGLSFEGEGNLYVTKATAGANLKVRLVLKPRA